MNETDLLNKFSDLGVAIDATQLSITLGLAFLLTLVVAKVYQITYRGVSFSPSFMHTLVLTGMVIAAVMIIIGSNIARAFSLVGALSIIRFRNAVKDTRDVAFIFLAMGVGMACGTGFFMISIILTAITCGAALIMSFVRFGEHGMTERIVRIHTPAVAGFEKVFEPVLRENTIHHNLVSAETTRMGTELELTFAIKVAETFSPEKLMKELGRLNENLKVQIMGSSHVLEL